MVFHESLNPERKFSLVTPLVFIAILGGTTGVLEVAIAVSPQSPYASNPQAMLAEAAAPAGSDKSECTADSPTGQIDPATKKIKKVGKKCKPAATKGETLVTVDDGCEPNDFIKAGQCTVIYCSPSGVCAEIRQDSEPKNIPQSTKQLFQMVNNVQTAPDSGAEFVGLTTNDPKLPGTLFAKDLTDQRMSQIENAFKNDFDASIPAPNKGGISTNDAIQNFGTGPTAPLGTGPTGFVPFYGSTDLANQTMVMTPTNNPAGFTDQQVAQGWLNQSQNSFNTPSSQSTFPDAQTPLAEQGWAAFYGEDKKANIEQALADVRAEKAAEINRRQNELAVDRPAGLFPEDYNTPKYNQLLAEEKALQQALATAQNPTALDKAVVNQTAWRPEVNPATGEDVEAFVYQKNPPNDGLDVPRDQNAKPELSTTPKPGVPDPNKTYLEQVDEKGNKVLCNSLGDCKPAQTTQTPPPGKAPPSGPDAKPPAGPGATQTGPGAGQQPPAGGSNPMSALGSLLSGLAGALKPSPPSAPAQACSTDPNAYAQQQQQYQQALLQYNFQLQQYQYQQNVAQYQSQLNGGLGAPTPPMPVQPTPCTPSTGNQCTANAPTPNPANCTTGWQPVYSGACITNWTCPSGPSTPTATLACDTDLADVGQTIGFTYSCSSGLATSTSFKVTTQPDGTATTTVKNPPAGTNTATYTLACTDNGRTGGANCSVQINRPSIILVANPKTVAASSTSQISWLTTGMDSCVISSPDLPGFTDLNSSNTSVTGTATTPPLTSAARFTLDCTTLAGGTRSASTTVHISGVSDDFNGDLVTVSSTFDGHTTGLGSTTLISWRTVNPPTGSAMSLWLTDAETGDIIALITGAKAPTGTYSWTLPAAGSSCPQGTAYVCASDLTSGHRYVVQADLYTPANADLGDPATNGGPNPHYIEYGNGGVFTMQ